MKEENFNTPQPTDRRVKGHGIVYLASQYSAKDPGMMEERYNQACRATYVLTDKGFTVYSPIVHFHEIAKRFDLPRDFKFWSQHNHRMLKACSDFLVLDTPTALDSRGVCFELGVAKALHIPCFSVAAPDYFLRPL